MQGVLRIMENLGSVLGPIWVGFTLHYLYAMLSLMLFLYTMALVSIVTYYVYQSIYIVYFILTRYMRYTIVGLSDVTY